MLVTEFSEPFDVGRNLRVSYHSCCVLITPYHTHQSTAKYGHYFGGYIPQLPPEAILAEGLYEVVGQLDQANSLNLVQLAFIHPKCGAQEL